MTTPEVQEAKTVANELKHTAAQAAEELVVKAEATAGQLLAHALQVKTPVPRYAIIVIVILAILAGVGGYHLLIR